MKLKYYLRGIGVGVIATTLILMVVFALHKKDMITDDEVIARAAQLGMVMAEDLNASDKLADQNDRLDDENVPAQDGMQDVMQPETDEPEINEPEIDVSDEEESQITVATDAEDDAEPEESHVTVEQVEFTIVGGEYSDTVCKKLKEAGLIEDEKDFNKYLAKGGYDSLIQPGNYVIPKDAEYKEIVSIITERRSERKNTSKKS